MLTPVCITGVSDEKVVGMWAGNVAKSWVHCRTLVVIGFEETGCVVRPVWKGSFAGNRWWYVVPYALPEMSPRSSRWHGSKGTYMYPAGYSA
jgi:hypothetical protein